MQIKRTSRCRENAMTERMHSIIMIFVVICSPSSNHFHLQNYFIVKTFLPKHYIQCSSFFKGEKTLVETNKQVKQKKKTKKKKLGANGPRPRWKEGNDFGRQSK